MIYIEKPDSDPFFNLAAEEYVVKHLDEEVLMLWQSDWCVVTGKHQLAYAEINPKHVFERKVHVIRRISGGGTVVHGPGNLNFSIVTDNRNKHYKIDFRTATLPIIEFLKQFKLKVELTGVSNLSVNDLKISGNAAHVYRHRSLHHGTLLFDAPLSDINSLIRRPNSPYLSRAIPSSPARIANISSLAGITTNITDFKQLLKEHLFKAFNIKHLRYFTDLEIERINQLAGEKYRTHAWNFGYGPDYSFKQSIIVGERKFDVSFTVIKGVVESFTTTDEGLSAVLSPLLRSLPHSQEAIAKKIWSSSITEEFSESELNQLIIQLF